MTGSRSILLTGGAGYIGSHTAVALVEAGFDPVILDNFANSHPVVLERLQRITGRALPLERGDVLDTPRLLDVLRRHRPAGVVHFAGDKAVGESVADPLKYYRNNLGGATSLLQAMSTIAAEDGAAPTLVFSSSATVYGDPARVPITEDFPRSHTNPYGHTKLVIEDMLTALRTAQPRWRIGTLRYFNPVGAHVSGASSARTRPASPTTSCRMWHRSPWACAGTSTCSAATTPHPMAPACATSST